MGHIELTIGLDDMGAGTTAEELSDFTDFVIERIDDESAVHIDRVGTGDVGALHGAIGQDVARVEAAVERLLVLWRRRVTDEQIRRFMSSAGEAGDLRAVNTCRIALDLEDGISPKEAQQARDVVALWIDDSKAMGD